MKRLTIAFFCIALLASCGPPPGPTKRAFQREEIVGIWTAEGSRPLTQSMSGMYSVRLTLRADGSFDQSIVVKGKPQTHQASGTWALNGSMITFTGLLMEDWDQTTDKATWTKGDVEWWFVDASYDELPVGLFGGLHPDPDSFTLWTHVQPEKEPE